MISLPGGAGYLPPNALEWWRNLPGNRPEADAGTRPHVDQESPVNNITDKFIDTRPYALSNKKALNMKIFQVSLLSQGMQFSEKYCWIWKNSTTIRRSCTYPC